MHRRARTSLLTIAAIALSAPALAQGLDAPAKNFPSPQGDVSPQVQKLIARAFAQRLKRAAEDRRGMKPSRAGAEPTIKNLPGLLEAHEGEDRETTMDGVRVFMVTPATASPKTGTAC